MQTHKPRRILVANRGEIALRVIRAIREMGHIPLTVFSEVDRMSLHVAKAEEAYCLGDGPSTQTYLNIPLILEAAKKGRAEAIHPGYGFLSEKAEFAKEVSKAGIIFIGPSAEAIRKMGDKVMARTTMSQIGGLPLVPGTKNAIIEEKEAIQEAKMVGFPLMIKALAGGGGRGMRLVNQESEFLSLFRRATSEASKAFGDGRVYLERYVTSPHHIEVQVIADQHGNVCHLFERECSVQRRHQKLIEEAPSPFLSAKTRALLCEAAVKAVKEIGYQNAGTIEFLMDQDQNFYFMEMNTRLQVEHPITEWITGVDLVQEQIRIAFGEKLGFEQTQLEKRGHAIEFRICAEDPEKFLPQAGLVSGVSFPAGIGVRVDSHLYRGYEIPVLYDSLIAKLSIWGRTREEAMARAKAALMDTRICGIKVNTPVFLQILENQKFLSGNYTTRLIGEDFEYREQIPTEEELHHAVVAAAVSAYQKEYSGGIKENPSSLWRDLGRREGLR